MIITMMKDLATTKEKKNMTMVMMIKTGMMTSSTRMMMRAISTRMVMTAIL